MWWLTSEAKARQLTADPQRRPGWIILVISALCIFGRVKRERRCALGSRVARRGAYFCPNYSAVAACVFCHTDGGWVLCDVARRRPGSASFGLWQHQTFIRLQSFVSSSERIPYQVYGLWKTLLSHLSPLWWLQLNKPPDAPQLWQTKVKLFHRFLSNWSHLCIY